MRTPTLGARAPTRVPQLSFAIGTHSHSGEGTVLTERLAARIGIDRRASSSPGISLAVVLRDLSRTYDADAVERR